MFMSTISLYTNQAIHAFLSKRALFAAFEVLGEAL